MGYFVLVFFYILVVIDIESVLYLWNKMNENSVLE